MGRTPSNSRESAPTLVDAVAQLAKLYGSDPPDEPVSPFELILWKNIGYLVDDSRRAALFAEFSARVGLSAAAIAAAPPATLMDIASRGGMRPEARVEKWRRVAAITIENAGGDLDAALRKLPIRKAAALLKTFPSIGDPGADEILLLSGLDVRPTIDSNGLRVMLRLGLCKEGTSYSTSYREAAGVLRDQGEPGREWLISAFRILRAHGLALCKRSAPKCVACPLEGVCPRVQPRAAY
jgi:endonuclease-3